jgi:hypothetical protein
VKIVRESPILDSYPGVALGESSMPPRLSRAPIQLGRDSNSEDVHTSKVIEYSNLPGNAVFFTEPLTSIYGIPIAINTVGGKNNHETRKATAGGVVSVGGKLFSMTVAHACFGNATDIEFPEINVSEFSLEFDDNQDDEDDSEFEDNFVTTTSRGE